MLFVNIIMFNKHVLVYYCSYLISLENIFVSITVPNYHLFNNILDWICEKGLMHASNFSNLKICNSTCV